METIFIRVNTQKWTDYCLTRISFRNFKTFFKLRRQVNVLFACGYVVGVTDVSLLYSKWAYETTHLLMHL